MRTKQNKQIIAVVGLGVLMLTIAWTVCADNGTIGAAGDDYEKSIIRGSGLEWSPVGTWIVTAPTPMGNITLLHSVHAQDSSGNHYGGILRQVNTNHTFFGIFPQAEAGTDIWAVQTVRTGQDSFESTFLYYLTKKGEGPIDETVAIAICNATWRLTGPNTVAGESTIAVYLAEQDVDGDGLSDEGQEPAVCLGFTYTCRVSRIHLYVQTSDNDARLRAAAIT
ncbi:MAG: hypothetical protein ACYTBS_18240 [Planctomycetota bacterium]